MTFVTFVDHYGSDTRQFGIALHTLDEHDTPRG
jgi:hypothetical protein